MQQKRRAIDENPISDKGATTKHISDPEPKLQYSYAEKLIITISATRN